MAADQIKLYKMANSLLFRGQEKKKKKEGKWRILLYTQRDKFQQLDQSAAAVLYKQDTQKSRRDEEGRAKAEQ